MPPVPLAPPDSIQQPKINVLLFVTQQQQAAAPTDTTKTTGLLWPKH